MAESPLQAYVYAATTEDQVTVLRIFDEEELEYHIDLANAPATLALGEQYGALEVEDEDWAPVARRLINEAPTAVFELWQDPSEDSDGSYIAHVPGVGTLEAGCDINATPHVSIATLRTALSDMPADMPIGHWLAGPGAEVLGTRVLDALRHYQAAAGR